MKVLKPVSALTMAMMLYPGSASAFIFDGMNNSEFSTFLSVASVVAVVSGPFYLSWKGVDKTSGASTRGKAAAICLEQHAEPVPDMEIKSIESANGVKRIVLENPKDTQQVAVLEWPQRENDPVNALAVGELMSFQPTPARSGWIMRSSDGNSVGFLPTMGSATDAHSAPI